MTDPTANASENEPQPQPDGPQPPPQRPPTSSTRCSTTASPTTLNTATDVSGGQLGGPGQGIRVVRRCGVEGQVRPTRFREHSSRRSSYGLNRTRDNRIDRVRCLRRPRNSPSAVPRVCFSRSPSYAFYWQRSARLWLGSHGSRRSRALTIFSHSSTTIGRLPKWTRAISRQRTKWAGSARYAWAPRLSFGSCSARTFFRPQLLQRWSFAHCLSSRYRVGRIAS
jgi:hypothetical protein